MATQNFKYENRIIVVTNDDMEMQYTPTLGEYDDHIGGRVVNSVSDFQFHKVVMTMGYYQDACISSYRKNVWDVFEEYFPMNYEIVSKTQVAKDLVYELHHYGSYKTLLRKTCGVKDLENAAEIMLNYLANLELKKVNKQMDEIKQMYGYDELKCIGTFSNGIGIYEKVK